MKDKNVCMLTCFFRNKYCRHVDRKMPIPINLCKGYRYEIDLFMEFVAMKSIFSVRVWQIEVPRYSDEV